MAHIQATITTAQKLSAQQRSQVRELLQQKVGAVTIEERIDPSVLGGLQISIGSQTLDATLAGKLQKMESQVPEVIVTSAVALTDQQRKKISSAFEKKVGSVQIREVVDPTLIGGVRLQYGSRELDGSIRGKLQQLRQQLLTAI